MRLTSPVRIIVALIAASSVETVLIKLSDYCCIYMGVGGPCIRWQQNGSRQSAITILQAQSQKTAPIRGVRGHLDTPGTNASKFTPLCGGANMRSMWRLAISSQVESRLRGGPLQRRVLVQPLQRI